MFADMRDGLRNRGTGNSCDRSGRACPHRAGGDGARGAIEPRRTDLTLKNGAMLSKEPRTVNWFLGPGEPPSLSNEAAVNADSPPLININR
jgi:hypothetical protein